jgi:hypothetical protein
VAVGPDIGEVAGGVAARLGGGKWCGNSARQREVEEAAMSWVAAPVMH